MADKRKFNKFGGISSETIDNVTITYDKYGNPKYVMLNMPYNSTAEGVNPVYIPEESDMYKKIMERSSSTFCDRMKNVDWQTLEEHEKRYGLHDDVDKVYAARKRFMEELPKYTNDTNKSSLSQTPLNAKKVEQKVKSEYNNYGGVSSERVGDVMIEYDVFGNPTGGNVKVPFNPKGYEAGWSGAPIFFSTNTVTGQGIIDGASTSFYERMKNVDWKKLEKDYGNKPEFQKAQKRFLEEEQKQPGLIQTLSNFADKYAEKIVNFIDPNTKGGIEK